MIPTYKGLIPTLTTAQMIEVDRLMIEEYQIELIQMMENAGRALAMLAREDFLEGESRKVIVVAGTGGNGGGALVAARRLHGWGFDVQVLVINEAKMQGVPGHQLEIIKHLGISISDVSSLDFFDHVDLVVDGAIGYSLSGDPRGDWKEAIVWMNRQSAAILSLDTPSGLDLTTGNVHDPCVTAQATLTLALPKKGLFSEEAKKVTGELYLADISVPPSLYACPTLGIEIPELFAKSDLLKINSAFEK